MNKVKMVSRVLKYSLQMIVELTFAWVGRYRRLSKDYEGLTETSKH